MAIGDVMLAQSIGRRIVSQGPLAPWRRVIDHFDDADLVVANLECTISTGGTRWPKTFAFRAPPAAADSLVAAGVDVVSLGGGRLSSRVATERVANPHDGQSRCVSCDASRR